MFCGGKGINLSQKGQKYEEKVNGDNISQASPQTAVRATVKACCGNDRTKENRARGKPNTVETRAGGDEEHKEKNQIPGPALVCLRPPR